MRKKFVSLLLVFTMVLGLLPATAAAADESVTATVSYTAQAAGVYLCPPQQKVSVSSGLAEQYGYTDSVDSKEAVSLLDVLVAAHINVFGAEDAADCLVIGDSGWITDMFGCGSNCGYMLNKGYVTSLSTPVKDNDCACFFVYQDDWAMDLYTWVSVKDAVYTGQPFDVTVTGLMYGWEGYNYATPEALKAAATPVEDAALAWVDMSTGEVTPIEDVLTNENGTATIPAPEQAGTYYLTAATSEEGESYIIMNPVAVTVAELTLDTRIETGIRTGKRYYAASKDHYAYGDEWAVYALLRSGVKLDKNVLNAYDSSVEAAVANWDADTLATDVERTALALAILGKDITNVGGVNLAALIYNRESFNQGSNALAYALLALDARDTTIPTGAAWTRETLVAELLTYQNANGGFGLTGNTSASVDMTAMALQALAPYREDATVSAAVDKALDYLLEQMNNHDYGTAESNAQVLLALTSLGVDPADSKFGSAENNLIVTMIRDYCVEDSGFTFHGKLNPISTVQALEAMEACSRLRAKADSYWDLTRGNHTINDNILSSANSENGGADVAPAAAATVTYTAQAANAFMGVQVDARVKSDLAESYGYTDGISGVSILDVLVKAHEDIFGDAFTPDTASDYLALTSDGWITAIFGVETGACGYYQNDESAYSLATEVKNDDFLAFYLYQDTVGYSDQYGLLTLDDAAVTTGSELKAELQAYAYDSSYNLVKVKVEGARFGWVDIISGEITPIDGVVTDRDGAAAVSVPDKAGVYYLTACTDMEQGAAPLVMPLKEITVTQAAVPDTITVSFTLLGDSAHGDNGTIHTNAAGNLTVWIDTASYTVESDSTVLDVFELALTQAGMTWINKSGSNYISAVNGLAEFANGPASGWMYTLNGAYSDLGVAEQTLTDGDAIVFHYTDNYNKEYDPHTPDPLPFVDVSGDAYYHDAVAWALDKGVTSGMDATHFGPDASCTRAQAITFLWRAAGSPEPTAKTNPFTDVKETDYFCKAVLWALENGITSGTSATTFSPNAKVTRAQVVTFLYKARKGSAPSDSPFADVPGNAYYAPAVNWALANGVTAGTSATTFSPNNTCLRAQIVTFLYKAYKE